jgi:hypothetical protein
MRCCVARCTLNGMLHFLGRYTTESARSTWSCTRNAAGTLRFVRRLVECFLGRWPERCRTEASWVAACHDRRFLERYTIDVASCDLLLGTFRHTTDAARNAALHDRHILERYTTDASRNASWNRRYTRHGASRDQLLGTLRSFVRHARGTLHE